jgi:hypothetical protein
MQTLQDPVSGLILPRQFVDEKLALKKVIDDLVDSVVNANQHIRETYYLVLHAKFDKYDPTKFVVSQPVITFRLPPFTTGQMVFWVSNQKGICELLWMTSKKNGKIAVDFNKEGVAYLQAKGAMPS